jgi:hypothetical protein
MRSPASATQSVELSRYDDLVERIALLIRQSAAVQEARCDILLDAAVLAAEQVQDVRLNVIETPAEISGWEIWTEIAIGFLIDSKLPGKALSALTRKVVGQAVKTNTLFFALPKSEEGRELAFYAKNVFRDSARSVLRSGLPALKLPGLSDKDGLNLYHAALRLFVSEGSKTYEDLLNAAVKAANAKRKAPKPQQNDPIPVSDSAGVAILSAAQDYARASRLGIRVRHAALEAYVRRGAQPTDLALVVETVSWDGLDDAEQKGELQSLTVARDKYRLLLEGLIWARLYDFREAPPSSASNPPILVNKDTFDGPKDRLQQYWRGRFQAAADQYASSRGGTVVPGDTTQSLRLRRYLAAINYQITQQAGAQQDLMTSVKALA